MGNKVKDFAGLIKTRTAEQNSRLVRHSPYAGSLRADAARTAGRRLRILRLRGFESAGYSPSGQQRYRRTHAHRRAHRGDSCQHRFSRKRRSQHHGERQHLELTGAICPDKHELGLLQGSHPWRTRQSYKTAQRPAPEIVPAIEAAQEAAREGDTRGLTSRLRSLGAKFAIWPSKSCFLY